MFPTPRIITGSGLIGMKSSETLECPSSSKFSWNIVSKFAIYFSVSLRFEIGSEGELAISECAKNSGSTSRRVEHGN